MTTFCHAQTFNAIDIPSSPNPVGSGARALGMGSAFIAIADDSTSASWNPGGLIQLDKPEFSIVGKYFTRNDENSFGLVPVASGKQSVNENQINYFSLSYPFHALNHNMIVSINYQYLYDFNKQWDFPFNYKTENEYQHSTFHYNQGGNLSAIGLCYCIELKKNISFGITLNIWDDLIEKSGWEEKTNESGVTEVVISEMLNIIDTYEYEYELINKYSFRGINANLGMLWNVNSNISFGAVFKLPFRAKVNHEYQFTSWYQFVGKAVVPFSNKNSTAEKLDMPMSYGIGLAYRFSDNLTFSADIYKTHWQDFIQRDAEGNEISPITGTLTSNADIDPTHQVRLGAEYLLIKPKYVIPFRCGLFYDPAPAQTSPDDYYGFSLGSGFWYGPYIYDIAYQYRFGNDVGDQLMKGYDFSQDIDEHTVYMSMIYHF
jgi:long-subunit fatty acid transport protein